MRLTKRELDILEERGLWEASSFLHRRIKKLIRNRLPLELRYIKEAHSITFREANPPIAGRYRRDNSPEVTRIDGTPLPITDWRNIGEAMAELDAELRHASKGLKHPTTEEEFEQIISLAARLSHRLACIHPFENGNGRSSRLLLNAVLLRSGLSEVAIKRTKPEYLRAMRQADDGDFSMLEDTIIDGLIENAEKKEEFIRRKQSQFMRKKHFNKKKNKK